VKRIGVDVDGVLADFVGEVQYWARTSFERGPGRFKREQITEFDILKCWGIEHLWGELDRYVSRPGVCLGLAPYDGAKEFLAELRKRADVVIVTSPWKTSPYWMHERRQWLERKLNYDGEIIFTKRKDLIRVDALIDDCAEHVDASPGVGVVIDQPWNQQCKTGLRATSLPNAIQRLEQVGLI
jgi:5'(3')-deoxyribonucleotidase